MTFRLATDQIIPAWRTLTVEVTFAPKTGTLRPWELHGCFTYPHKRRVFWGSFKTEAAAQKKATQIRKRTEETYGKEVAA